MRAVDRLRPIHVLVGRDPAGLPALGGVGVESASGRAGPVVDGGYPGSWLTPAPQAPLRPEGGGQRSRIGIWIGNRRRAGVLVSNWTEKGRGAAQLSGPPGIRSSPGAGLEGAEGPGAELRGVA